MAKIEKCCWCESNTTALSSRSFKKVMKCWIRCTNENCEATGPTRDTVDAAIVVWNTLMRRMAEPNTVVARRIVDPSGYGALANDGSLWQLVYPEQVWKQLPPLPQPHEVATETVASWRYKAYLAGFTAAQTRSAVICDETYVEPGDLQVAPCTEAAEKIRSMKPPTADTVSGTY